MKNLQTIKMLKTKLRKRFIFIFKNESLEIKKLQFTIFCHETINTVTVNIIFFIFVYASFECFKFCHYVIRKPSLKESHEIVCLQTKFFVNRYDIVVRNIDKTIGRMRGIIYFNFKTMVSIDLFPETILVNSQLEY